MELGDETYMEAYGTVSGDKKVAERRKLFKYL